MGVLGRRIFEKEMGFEIEMVTSGSKADSKRSRGAKTEEDEE